MPIKKVLFLWKPKDWLRKHIEEALAGLPNLELIFPEDTSADSLLSISPTANIMVGWRPTKEMLWNAKNLEVFINPGTGIQHHLDNFRDLQLKRDVKLVNGHGHAHLSAQHMVAMLLTLTNQIIPHHQWMVNGKWRTGDKDAASTPLLGRHIGLCGYGAINKHVHRYLSGFDVTFSAFRRSWHSSDKYTLPTPITKYNEGELEAFLQKIDILLLALPLTSKTTGIIGKKELELLGKDGIIANVGRGQLIEEKSLYKALKNRTIKGAALDVWYNYRPEANEEGLKYPYSFPFHELENVVLSPHRAGTPNFEISRWIELTDIIKNYVVKGELTNIIDLEAEY